LASPGDTLIHPTLQQRLTFLETSAETGGAYTRIRLEVGAGGLLAMSHIHPRLHERFDIVSGSWQFDLGGVQRHVGSDDTVNVAPGVAHHWRIAGSDDGVAFITYCPSLRTEAFIETMFGLAQDGLADPETGLPSLAWLALIFSEYGEDFAIPAEPPLPILLEQLRPIAEEARRQGLRLPYPYPHKRPSPTAAPNEVTAADYSGSRII
jgi:mannose-6-phosphate isomerase-like protein (cupin superfamily)